MKHIVLRPALSFLNSAGSDMKDLRTREVNPVPVLIGAVLLIGLGVYFFWVAPARSASQTEKTWTTEAAVQERMNKKSGDAAYQQKVQEILAKEGRGRTAPVSRREKD
jgi:hypothetical protein